MMPASPKPMKQEDVAVDVAAMLECIKLATVSIVFVLAIQTLYQRKSYAK
jgi:hypothetical protein